MVGDGIRGDFTVTGDAVHDRHRGQVQGGRRQLQAVRQQPDRRADPGHPDRSSTRSRSGDIAAAKAQYPIARTYYERIEPVAESFPDDLDPRIDLREADLEPGQKWTGFHRAGEGPVGDRPAARRQRDRRPARWPTSRNSTPEVKAPDWTIDSTQIAGGAQGLLDEIAIQQDHRRGGHLQPHRPVGLQRQRRRVADRGGLGAPDPRRAQPRPGQARRPAVRRGRGAADKYRRATGSSSTTR